MGLKERLNSVKLSVLFCRNFLFKVTFRGFVFFARAAYFVKLI